MPRPASAACGNDDTANVERVCSGRRHLSGCRWPWVSRSVRPAAAKSSAAWCRAASAPTMRPTRTPGRPERVPRQTHAVAQHITNRCTARCRFTRVQRDRPHLGRQFWSAAMASRPSATTVCCRWRGRQQLLPDEVAVAVERKPRRHRRPPRRAHRLRPAVVEKCRRRGQQCLPACAALQLLVVITRPYSDIVNRMASFVSD